MCNKNITLDIKFNFHQQKSPILIQDVKIDRIVVSDKVPLGKKGFKYFVGYKDDSGKVISLCIMLSKCVHVGEILVKLSICFYFDKK